MMRLKTVRASSSSRHHRFAVHRAHHSTRARVTTYIDRSSRREMDALDPDASIAAVRASTTAEIARENAGGDEKSMRTRLRVAGICCPSEVPLIHAILDGRPGVRAVKVIVPTQTVVVEHASTTASVSSIIDTLNAAGLDASLAPTPKASGEQDFASYGATLWDSPPPFFVLASCILLAVSLLHSAGGALDQLKWVALGAVVIGLPPILHRAFRSLRIGVIDINTLMTLAVVGACALQEFGEAGAVVALFGLSEFLEDRALRTATTAMGSVLALQPQFARRLSASDIEVPIEDVAVGETVLVRPGESVPLDGVVVGGSSVVNESMLTGESVPLPKSPGDEVFGGTINQGGVLEVKISAVASNCAVVRLIRLVEEAQASRSNIERTVEKFARFYTPAVIFGALLLAITPYAEGETGTRPAYTACVLLVVACPCALVLSTPVVVVCGLTHAARRGMLIKGSVYLERLGRLRVVFIDKTGTLTDGCFSLVDIRLATPQNDGQTPTFSESELLLWACALESRASHPVATAVLAGAGAATRLAAKTCVVNHFETLPGEGASALVDGKKVEIGGTALANRRNWRASDVSLASTVEEWERAGATAIWLGVDEEVAGVFRCEDTIRHDAPAAVARLRDAGVEVTMLTGDSQGSAARVAKSCGIYPANVHAELSPSRKLEEVKSRINDLQSDTLNAGGLFGSLCGRGVVAMVGDGINDAPALATADVGVAMGVAGTAAAMETADITLLTNDLGRLAEAVALGNACLVKIRQNIYVSIGAKSVILALSLMGRTGLWEAVIADVGTALAVILNGMTMLNHGPKISQKVDRKNARGKRHAVQREWGTEDEDEHLLLTSVPSCDDVDDGDTRSMAILEMAELGSMPSPLTEHKHTGVSCECTRKNVFSVSKLLARPNKK